MHHDNNKPACTVSDSDRGAKSSVGENKLGNCRLSFATTLEKTEHLQDFPAAEMIVTDRVQQC